jgi:two-component system sensor histidine kinase HydH
MQEPQMALEQFSPVARASRWPVACCVSCTVIAVTHARSLPRWSRTAVVAAIGLMCAALIVVVWTTQRSVRDTRATLLRGRAAEANAVVRARMMELEDSPLPERVVAAFDAASSAQSVRYLAALDPDDTVSAEAGVPSSTRAALATWVATAAPGEPVRIGDRIRVVFKRTRKPAREDVPPPPPASGTPARRGGPVAVLLEIDTAVVDELDAAATWSLVIGTAAAATLLVLAVVLVRLSLRREDAVRAAEQARHLASLGQMSAVLAHEIRNPLASLKGNAQLLARSLPDGEKPRAKADRVVDEAVRLEHLTNDLLAFARSGEIKVADADPAALLRSAAADVESADRIRIDDGDAPRSWPLDADRMRQVLVNLLENAAEMSEGPIEAAVERDGAALRFTVRDHGPGLPAADLERLFEPFFTKRTRGTGLGLAVCKRLVDLHGGTIAAKNADGGGAEFSIALPRGAA